MSKQDDTTDRDGKAELTAEQYYVTRQRGTEPPFSGEYYNHQAEGTYHCVCCGAPLFASAQKYDSGSGWPSFWAPADQARVEERLDLSHGMKRTEIRCAACEAHLGHVFNDGPAPTGQRYCINSLALRFTDKDR